MDVMPVEPLSPKSIKRTSLSPTFEHLSYFDSEPYIQDIYDMSPDASRSPFPGRPSSKIDRKDDLFLQSRSSSFIPSSTSSEGTWDDYIAWDSLRDPMDLQPSWLSSTPQDQTAPLFDDTFDPFTRSDEPDSTLALPAGAGASARRQNDQFEDYLRNTSASSFPTIPAESTFDASQKMSPIKHEQRDSGFVSQSESYNGRPSLDLVVPSSTIRSGSQSPASTTRSPTQGKRRTSQGTEIKPSPNEPTPFKKPKKAKSAAHNDVEKRYRTNLNIKIAELSAAVPALRAAAASVDLSGDEMDIEAKPGYPARGLKKATILSKATEYIKTLESERRGLEEENRTLKKRLMLCGRIAGEEGLK